MTAGGENVAPIPIEDCIKEALPVVSNCMVVGDYKKFLSVLLTVKVREWYDCNTVGDISYITRRSLEVKYAPRTYLCLANQNLPQGSWYFSKRYDFYATHAIL